MRTSQFPELGLPPGPGGLTLLKYSRILRKQGLDAVVARLYRRYGSIARINFELHPLTAKFLNTSLSAALQPYTALVGPDAHRLVMFSPPTVVQRGPTVPQQFETSDGYLLGWPSLASIDGEMHWLHRRLVLSAFRSDRLRNYAPLIADVLQRRIANWSGKVDLFQEMFQLSLAILVRTMLGISPDTELYRAISAEFLPLSLRTKTTGELLQAKEALWVLLRDIISMRRSDPRDAAVTAIMAARDASTAIGLSEEDTLSYAFMLLDFGHADVALYLTYAISSVLIRRDFLERILDEHHSFLLSDCLPLDDHVPFTMSILREVERLYPSVTHVDRLAVRDLSFHGYYIPQGSLLVDSIFLSHRLPTLFADPHKFDPDRYSQSHARSQQKIESSLVGFGAGYHACVARAFTQLVGCVVLQTLFSALELRKFGNQSVPKIDYTGTCPHPAQDIIVEII